MSKLSRWPATMAPLDLPCPRQSNDATDQPPARQAANVSRYFSTKSPRPPLPQAHAGRVGAAIE
jgi:hypothetical protein